MAETLLNQIIQNEINLDEFLEWLSLLNYQDSKFIELTNKYNCSRTDFVGYFLNFIHEELGSIINEKRTDFEETKSSSEINRSQSYPLDLSSETESNISNSTPKLTKVNSDTSVLHYMSPISPIYKTQNSFSTPKKSAICLGDFIITQKIKKKSETKKRIKPTNLTANRSTFHKSENSYDFNENDFTNDSNYLNDENMKIFNRNSMNVSPRKLPRGLSGEINPDLESVTHREEIGKLVEIYVQLLDNSFVLNLTSEIYYLINLLLKKQYYNSDWGIEILSEKLQVNQIFTTIHNLVFFASKTLERQVQVLKNYDNSTIRLLLENTRLQDFTPILIGELQKVIKPDRIIEIETAQNNICFNLDTDNRQNFPNGLSFHAFRKQRDLFYEILRIWEIQHLSPGFNYIMSLSGKIKTLLSLSNEPTNFIHFSRLFKSQLLSNCKSPDPGDLLNLNIDAQKLNKLKSRCTTKAQSQGLNSLPIFNEYEEFYKDFILAAANFNFNRHLSDILIEEITELNESNFGSNELEEDCSDVDLVTKKSYYSCIKNLRTLSKFLGFLESLPYKSDFLYSENLLTTHLKIRKQIRHSFDIKTLLENSIRRKSVILCVPWLIKYLSMLDYITLKLPYFLQIQTILFWIYRNFNWGPLSNIYLIKFSLGWLFELPNIPDNDYLHFCTEISTDLDETRADTPKFALDQLEIVDQDILYFCCPYLDEIKKLLSASSSQSSISIKHITPITALQSPDEVARKKLEQQLEESFFNGQPISLRKTVEFVSERVASTCVKHVCHNLVPKYKNLALEKLREIIKTNQEQDLENFKVTLKTKANQLATSCLDDLRKTCQKEIEEITNEKILLAIESLVSLDILPQTKQTCVGFTKKICLQRVAQWCDSHVTISIFNKDFNDEIQKFTTSDTKKPRKPIFMLPPGGTSTQHNDETYSAAHLLEKYRVMTVNVIERKCISLDNVLLLLDETSKSIDQRGDFNQCILATICTQLLDLMLLLLSYDWHLVSHDDVMSKSCDIWKLYYNGCDDLFKSLLCPRNVMIFSQSRNCKATWNAFARFCAVLIKKSLLSCDVFEGQCTGIFRTDWDQDTLKLITDFFKTFGSLFRDQGGNTSDFTFLLEFFSDYCEDLF